MYNPEKYRPISPMTDAILVDGLWVVSTRKTNGTAPGEWFGGTRKRVSKHGFKTFEDARDTYLSGRMVWA
jgi:hypothetical protein